jgi:PTS system nitrogen regulatory IIA component
MRERNLQASVMLTIEEVAARLNVPIETVDRWIRQGKIPMQKDRGRYTIRPAMLERWANDHKLEIGIQRPVPVAPSTGEQAFDGIFPAMQRGGIFYDIGGDGIESVLRAVVDVIPGIPAADKDMVLESLIEREQLASTGIGNGIALPHPRSNPGITLAKPQITTCILNSAVDFKAIDARPVSTVMVLLSNSTKQHLTMLSKLSFFLRNTSFRRCLIEKTTQEEIYNHIEAMESEK